MTPRSGIVVISGGSAANNLVDVFSAVADSKNCRLSYILPVSDNGGSSSELIRVLGGPGIGDVRSRLVRLIPQDPYGENGMKAFFNHRLAKDPDAARNEWLDIVEARHTLWKGIPSEKQELIRSFLNTINLEIVKRARPSSVFNFQSASIGNLFLSGARLFTGSFEAAIYLLSAITSVPQNVEVVPAVNSNFALHICAALEDGSTIAGQNSISHPSPVLPTKPTNSSSVSVNGPGSSPRMASANPGPSGGRLAEALLRGLPPVFVEDTRVYSSGPDSGMEDEIDDDEDKVEDANLPGSLRTLRRTNIEFHKTDTADLPSRIHRIFYINPFGQEIRVAANRKAVTALEDAACIVYSIGSLYTSIVPCLVLRHVGDAIATGSSSAVAAAAAGLLSRIGSHSGSHPTSGTASSASSSRPKVLILNGRLDRETGPAIPRAFAATDFVAALSRACAYSRGLGEPGRDEYRAYVTHVIHLEGDGAPPVDRAELRGLGIECVRLYGRKSSDGGMIYDPRALTQALEAIMGKRDLRAERSRRNTFEGGRYDVV